MPLWPQRITCCSAMAGRSRRCAEIGITLNLASAWPADPTPGAAAAARRVDGRENRWFLDPLFRGSYPADMVDLQRPLTDMRWVLDGDMETIAAPLDFLGVN